MTIEFFTGLEGCGATGDVKSLFTTCDFSYTSTNGFNGSKGMYTGFTSTTTINLSAAKTKVFGFHINPGRLYSPDDTNLYRAICVFSGPDIRIYNTESGLDIRRGSTQITLLPENILPVGTYAHMEVKLFSDPTAGTLEIKINGGSIYAGTGLNTDGADISGVLLGSLYSTETYYDNIFVADDWQGELVSMLCKPASDSATQFTPSAGTDNYAMVDDAGQDGDTTYVESSTVGHKDLYGFENVPTSEIEVKAITLVTVARKDDTGARALQIISKQDSIEYNEGDPVALPPSYPSDNNAGIRITKPLAPDGTAWTPAKLNACLFGFEVAS